MFSLKLTKLINYFKLVLVGVWESKSIKYYTLIIHTHYTYIYILYVSFAYSPLQNIFNMSTTMQLPINL